MRFITEFETDDYSYVRGIKKIHGEENIGHEIAGSFGWNEREVTKLDPDVRIIHVHKLEIEAFPMDRWVEFKKRLVEACNMSYPNGTTILWLLSELESFGKPVTTNNG